MGAAGASGLAYPGGWGKGWRESGGGGGPVMAESLGLINHSIEDRSSAALVFRSRMLNQTCACGGWPASRR